MGRDRHLRPAKRGQRSWTLHIPTVHSTEPFCVITSLALGRLMVPTCGIHLSLRRCLDVGSVEVSLSGSSWPRVRAVIWQMGITYEVDARWSSSLTLLVTGAGGCVVVFAIPGRSFMTSHSNGCGYQTTVTLPSSSAQTVCVFSGWPQSVRRGVYL